MIEIKIGIVNVYQRRKGDLFELCINIMRSLVLSTFSHGMCRVGTQIWHDICPIFHQMGTENSFN